MSSDINWKRREETLEKVSGLLEEGNTDALLFEAAQMLSQIFDKFTSRIGNNVEYTHFSVDLIVRCIAVKAYESLSAIIELVSSGKSYSARALLRPMCEEFIFLSFMKSIPEEGAEEYLYLKGDFEILQGLKAQHEFFPRVAQMFSFDAAPEDDPDSISINKLNSRISSKKKQLKELGKKLGWGDRPIPSAKYMAEATNNVPVYDFFLSRNF